MGRFDYLLGGQEESKYKPLPVDVVREKILGMKTSPQSIIDIPIEQFKPKAKKESTIANVNPEFAENHPTLNKFLEVASSPIRKVMETPFMERAGQTGAEIMTTVDNPEKATTGSRIADLTADLMGGVMGFTANPAGGVQSAGANLWGLSEKGVEAGMRKLPQLSKLPAVAQTGLKLGATTVPYEAAMAAANDRDMSAGEMGQAAVANAVLGMLPYGAGKLLGGKAPKATPLPEMRLRVPEMAAGRPTMLPGNREYLAWQARNVQMNRKMANQPRPILPIENEKFSLMPTPSKGAQATSEARVRAEDFYNQPPRSALTPEEEMQLILDRIRLANEGSNAEANKLAQELANTPPMGRLPIRRAVEIAPPKEPANPMAGTMHGDNKGIFLRMPKAETPKATPQPKGGLLGEGSISAAKFTIPGKMAEVGDGTRVRSFGVTGMESPITHPDTRAGLLMESMEGGKGTFERISHAQTEAGAKQFLADEGLERSVDYVLHSPDVSSYKTGLGKEVIIELQNQGRTDKAVDVYESLAEQLTRAGQEIEAVKLFQSLTPEGVTMKAAKDAKKAYDDLPAPTKQKHKKTTEDVQQAFDEINKEAVEEVIDKTPELKKPRKRTAPKDGQPQKEPIPKKQKEDTPASQLAERIKRHVATPKDKEDPVRDMVNTLFKKAREVLPKQAKRVPRDEMELIEDAIANKEKYKAVWDEAKNVLKAKYGDSPEIMNSVDSFIEHFINIPYSEASITKVTRQGIKDQEIDLAQLVRQHYTKQKDAGSNLVKSLVDIGGMAEQDAQVLAMEIGTKFEQITSKKKQQILDQMFRQRQPAARKAIDQRIIELSNMGALSKDFYRRFVAEKLGLPVLTEDMAKQLRQLAETAQTTTGRQSEVARAKIRNILAELKPVSTAQKIDAVRRSAMILNPKTLVSRNMGGNAILGAFENIKDIPGALADMATTAYLKKKGVNAARTTLMPSLEGIKTQGKGGIKGVQLVVDDIRQGVDTAPRGQYEIPIGKTFRGPGLLSKAANVIDQATTRGLQFGDRPFYQAAYDEALRQQMKIHNTTTPTAEMKAFAERVANDRTFQNDSEVSNAIKYLRRGINKIGAGFGLGSEQFGIGNIAVPFAKTPGNIMDKAVDYSPVGFIRAAREVYRGRKGGDFDQKRFVDAIGRAVTGTGLILLGYDLAQNGVITGQQDKSSKVASFMRNVGQNPYSYNMSSAIRLISGQDPKPQKGDVIRTYDFAQPVSVALAIGADLYSGIKDRKAASNVVVEALKSGGNTLMQQSVLQGLQKMMGGYDVMQNIVDTIFQAPLQFTPALGGQVAKYADDSTRETYSPDIFAGIANKAKAKIPGLSSTLPIKPDTLGRDMPSVQGGNSAWNTFLNPGTTRKYDPSTVEQKIIDVYRQTGNADILPRVADKTIKASGLDAPIQLTTEEYANYQRRLGELTAEKFSKINTSDPEAAAKKMVTALNDASEQARKEMLQSRGYRVVKKGSGIAIK